MINHIQLSALDASTVPKRILTAKIPSRAKAVWHALAIRQDVGPGIVCTATKEIAEKLNCSVYTVRRAIRDLVAAGLISRVPSGSGWKYPAYKIGKRRLKVIYDIESYLYEGPQIGTWKVDDFEYYGPKLSPDEEHILRDQIAEEKRMSHLKYDENRAGDRLLYLDALHRFGPELDAEVKMQAFAELQEELNVSMWFLQENPAGKAAWQRRREQIMANHWRAADEEEQRLKWEERWRAYREQG